MSLQAFNSKYETWYHGKNRVFVHLLFWLVIFLYEAVQTAFTVKMYTWLFYVVTLREVVTIALVHYFLLYYAIPKLLLKGKWVLFAASLFLCYAIMSAGLYYTLYFIRKYELGSNVIQPLIDFFLEKDFWITLFEPIKTYNVFVFYSSIFYGLIIKVTKEFFSSSNRSLRLEKENIKLEKEKTDMELDFLKAQIQPHFFFNTLNNLYSIVIDKDEFAADIVLKLSDLMRYSLYEAGSSKISLARELQFIQDYVRLEQIRHKDHVTISLDIQQVPANLEIPPLILITFVENAFKHGINNTIDASWAHIEASVQGTTLHFSIENSKPERLAKETVQGGIGLINVRRRLDLLYPDRYALTIQNKPTSYTVTLNLTLDEKPTALRDRGRRATLSEPH